MRSFLSILYIATIATASAVRNLTAGDIESFVAGHELSLVAFIAPWCVHCQDLAPEFESAAARLQPHGWPLARVDCEQNKQVCRDYRVNIYPTIRVFHGKEHSIYNGFRKSDAMVSFMKRHSQPVVTTLASASDVVGFSTKDRVTVVGYFDEEDNASKSAFSDTANMHRDKFLFGTVSDDVFGGVEGVKKPSIVLYKAFDEGKNVYAEALHTEKIDGFLAEATTPLIREVGVDLTFFPSNLAGKPIAIIFAETKEDRAQLAEQLRPVAEATKGQMVWVTADPRQYSQRASRVALKSGKWPAFAIEDGDNDFKFAYSKRGSISELSEMVIKKVVDDYLAGRLESSINSDPVPTAQEGPVMSVVANSYQEVIIDNDKDVLLLFYSPNCGHCKAMTPAYDELGDLLKPYSDWMTVAKIDATSNDVWPRVDRFPTIKLFKSGSKNEPVTYECNRTVDDFVQFVREHGSQGSVEVLGDLRLSHDEL